MKALTKNNRLSFQMNLNAWSDIHRETHRNGIHCDTMTLCSRKSFQVKPRALITTTKNENFHQYCKLLIKHTWNANVLRKLVISNTCIDNRNKIRQFISYLSVQIISKLPTDMSKLFKSVTLLKLNWNQRLIWF